MKPIEYSSELAAAICERIADGAPLYKLCQEEGFPSRTCVYEWFTKHAEFRAAFEVAKAEYADTEFDKLDEMMAEEPLRNDKGGIDMGWVQLRRVKFEALRYKLRCLNPRKYAERMELTGAGGDPLVPPSKEITPERLREGARRIAFMLHQADQQDRERAAAQLQPLRLVHELKLDRQ